MAQLNPEFASKMYEYQNAAARKSEIEDYAGAAQEYNKILQLPKPTRLDLLHYTTIKQKYENILSDATRKKEIMEKYYKHYRLNFDFIKQLQFENATLYYPGSDYDLGPLSFFFHVPGIENVVYADYSEGNNIAKFKENIARLLPDYKVEDYAILQPSDLGCSQHDFKYYDRHRTLPKENIENFGVSAKITKGNKSINFMYLFTEGCKTYEILVGAGFQIKILVLQDHGFGGNWTSFGGESMLYKQIVAMDALPEIIYSPQIESIWPGYESTNPPLFLKRGQWYKTLRIIFKKQVK